MTNSEKMARLVGDVEKSEKTLEKGVKVIEDLWAIQRKWTNGEIVSEQAIFEMCDKVLLQDAVGFHEEAMRFIQ